MLYDSDTKYVQFINVLKYNFKHFIKIFLNTTNKTRYNLSPVHILKVVTKRKK